MSLMLRWAPAAWGRCIAPATRLGRNVAIKVLPPAFATDPDRLRRFEQEARAVAALNHPHICQIYDVGRLQPDTMSAPGPSYLVLEYVDGSPLCGPLAADDALRLALQVASALDAAHRSGILHRDLKPANILVTRGTEPSSNRPTVKLLDFRPGQGRLDRDRRHR